MIDLHRLRHRLKHPQSEAFRTVPGTVLANRPAAVAIILQRVTNADSILLIQRAENPRDPWSGQVALPGGRHDPQDDSLLTTAIRETVEEVGVDLLAQAQCLGALKPIPARARDQQPDFSITPFVFQASELRPKVASAEVERFFWVPLTHLTDKQNRASILVTEGERDFALPAWDINNLLVWGLTHQILRGLLHVVEEA